MNECYFHPAPVLCLGCHFKLFWPNLVNLWLRQTSRANIGTKITWPAIAAAELLTTAANCCSFVAAENK